MNYVYCHKDFSFSKPCNTAQFLNAHFFLYENFSEAYFLDNFTYFRKTLVHNKNDIGCIFWCIRSCSCGIWTTLWVLFRNCMCHVWPFSAKQKWVGQKVFYMRLHDVFWFSRARVTIIFGFLCLHHSIF